MLCEVCKDTGSLAEDHEDMSIELYCDCARGLILNRQVCPNCGDWRGPKEVAKRLGLINCTCQRPMAGDAVFLTKPWWTAPAGKMGIIGGRIGYEDDFLHITFSASAFRDERYGVSCSGGPATISTPAFLLTPTDRFTTVDFWRWKDTPRAGGGSYYKLSVPVWEWDGSDLIMREDGEVVAWR